MVQEGLATYSTWCNLHPPPSVLWYVYWPTCSRNWQQPNQSDPTNQPRGTIISLSPVTVAGLLMTNCNARGGGWGSLPSLVVHLKPRLHNLPDLSGTVCPASCTGCMHVCVHGLIWSLQWLKAGAQCSQSWGTADFDSWYAASDLFGLDASVQADCLNTEPCVLRCFTAGSTLLIATLRRCMHIYIYIYIYMRVCVGVCVLVLEVNATLLPHCVHSGQILSLASLAHVALWPYSEIRGVIGIEIHVC